MYYGIISIVYFLYKYLENGGDKGEIEDFVYFGLCLCSKEEVIFMMVDFIEVVGKSLDYFIE